MVMTVFMANPEFTHIYENIDITQPLAEILTNKEFTKKVYVLWMGRTVGGQEYYELSGKLAATFRLMQHFQKVMDVETIQSLWKSMESLMTPEELDQAIQIHETQGVYPKEFAVLHPYIEAQGNHDWQMFLDWYMNKDQVIVLKNLTRWGGKEKCGFTQVNSKVKPKPKPRKFPPKPILPRGKFPARI